MSSKRTTKHTKTTKQHVKTKPHPKSADPAEAVAKSDEDVVLGTLTAVEADARLESGAPKAEGDHELLRLPRGAFLGLRKSGGLNFSSREVVVYPDGRVAYDARGVPQKEYNRLRRALNDAQVLNLRKLLEQTGFWMMETTGVQNPDAFAYEITARLGQRGNSIEVFDGSVPERLEPLLERLSKLLPEE